MEYWVRDIRDTGQDIRGEMLHCTVGLIRGVMWTFEYMVYLAFPLDFNYHIHVLIPILQHNK